MCIAPKYFDLGLHATSSSGVSGLRVSSLQITDKHKRHNNGGKRIPASPESRQSLEQAFEAVGKKVAEENVSHISDMMATFKGSLEEFARKYKKDINQDPAFRQQFQVMCASIG